MMSRLADVLWYWEKWLYWVKYIPLYPAWLWYCLRSGSFWFFTPSNPSLTFGGFEGESKREMYEQLPISSYPKSIYISPKQTFTQVEKQVDNNDFDLPFVVKPDVGMMGFLFRKIDTMDELRTYHESNPVEYIVQQLVKYSVEVSVFYYRFPNEEKGTITGFVKKEMLQVEGDGKATLKELITRLAPRPGYQPEEWIARHHKKLNTVIPAGDIFILSLAANLSRGGKLISLEHEKDDRLLKVFDDLSHYTKHFYYGRYDIKCASIEDLKRGKNFLILEYNGSGAEPHHIYGNGNTLIEAYKIILHHWKVLYKISRYNYLQGHTYWTFCKGWKYLRAAKKHFKLLRRLDSTLDI